MPFVADVFDALLIDEASGEVIASTTLQEGNIEVSMDESDIRGGRGNGLLAVLHSSRDIVISLTDASVNYGFMAKQLGADIATGAGVGYAQPKNYEVVDIDGATTGDQPGITLDKTPSDTTSLFIYNASGTKITGFTVSGNTVDFAVASPAVAVGDVVEVRTFKYATDAQTQTIEFDIEKLPTGVKLVLETIEIDGDETIKNILQYQFDKTVPQGNFSVTTAAERSGSTQAISLRVIKPDNTTKVGRLLSIPYAG